MSNTKAHRALREKFIIDHYEIMKRYVEKCRGTTDLPRPVVSWVDYTVRPALGYSKRTDAAQIWGTLRREFEYVTVHVKNANFTSIVKPWRPAVINPKAFHLFEVYGITEDRRQQLEDIMQFMLQNPKTGPDWGKLLDEIAELAENAGENAYMIVIATIHHIDNYMAKI